MLNKIDIETKQIGEELDVKEVEGNYGLFRNYNHKWYYKPNQYKKSY
jgi:hypothetical protein